MVIRYLLGRDTVIYTHRRNIPLCLLFLILTVGLYLYNTPTGVAEDIFIQSLAEKVSQAERQKTSVVSGKDGWLFFVPELRSISVGDFWGDMAKMVSKASNPAYADPLPAILDFKKQLDTVGIELIFVPIPAKATIYPEMISEHTTTKRTDKQLKEFYKILRKQGLSVLDLTDLFLENRNTNSNPLYCKQDTHWSGQACVLTAKAIATHIGTPSWMDEIPKRKAFLETRNVEITGDLWKELGKTDLPKEQLQLTFVKIDREATNLIQPFGKSWRESPVVLLGDSHNLVFHAGSGMHAQGAGLPDHLAYQLGFSVDVVAVRGSGATPSRLNLFRRQDYMKGKRVVVWCLSVREFTEGQGWRKVPVIK